jgi:hypothetical protein
MNMTEEQIKSVIVSVEKGNSEIQKGFGAMLFEQIMVQKNNRLKKNIG